MPRLPPPEGEAVEADELCVSFHGGLWLWTVVSRALGIVLSFSFDDRSGDALTWVWQDVPDSWAGVPIFTDAYGAYAPFFARLPGATHEVCDKGSGKTSKVESLNNLWRQRRVPACGWGLVRKSCGVCWRIVDDLYERMLILVDRHNRHKIEKWQWQQTLQEISKSQATIKGVP